MKKSILKQFLLIWGSVFLFFVLAVLFFLLRDVRALMMKGFGVGILLCLFSSVFFFLPLLSFLLYNHNRILSFKGWVIRYLLTYVLLGVSLWLLFAWNVQVGLGGVVALLVVKFSLVASLLCFFLKGK